MYPFIIEEEGQQPKETLFIDTLSQRKDISYTNWNGDKGELIGYLYTFDEYDWPEEPPVPPEPTDDDITAICITNRELHLKKVKQPNKLGNLYIITTRSKKKK